MGKIEITRQFVYKWRYVIGYTLIAILLFVSLVMVGLYIPGGLSTQEMQSVIQSNITNFKDFWSINVINLPYHIFQHASIALFGVSLLSIKLPSIILGFLSAVGLVLLLKRWFKPNIAILASLIALTTSQFMFVSQNGTPDIMFLFWPVWLILTASLVPTFEKYRKLAVAVFFLLAALSLYTPLSIYILAVMAGAIMIHPHLRYLIKQISKLEMIIGLVCILAVLSPLIIMASRTPSLLLDLAGIPTKWPNITENLKLLGEQYLSFAGSGGTTFITPFFELGSALLILLGVYFVFQNRVTAKSYIVTIWTLLLIPVVVLNPNATTITFLPLVLLLASGLNGLLAHWYGLFPRNPYARIGGLIPIVILVAILVSSGIGRYVYSYRYNPSLVYSFSRDLRFIPTDTKYLLVSGPERPFYEVVDKYNKNMSLIRRPFGDSFVATRAAKNEFKGYIIYRIITNSLSKDADRLYLYKKTAN